MALKLSLESTGAGLGALRIGGCADVAESVNLAIERNDGRYLGLHGQWQPTPYWHPQFSAEPESDGLRLALGPPLLDGIIAMQGAPLRIRVRIDDQEDSGVLRIRGTLIGSDAAAEERTVVMDRGDLSPTAAPVAPDPEPHDAVWTEQDMDALKLDDLPADPAPASSPPQRRPIWSWLFAVVPVLLVCTGLAVWYLGWLDDLLGQTPPEPQLAGGVTTSPDSTLTGVAFASDFLAAGPAAAAILAQAEISAQAGDCDAALLLYNSAAERDATLGVTVAQLFDPTSFAEGGCIDAASEDAALEYYLSAADAGVPEAMQRAGEILTARASSGPVHQQGLELLRRSEQTDRR
jgi:hypothetical protein